MLHLRRGDSFQFDGATPHIFSNPYEEPASLLWIISHEPLAARQL
ncbi:cupin domain-containing protein [Bordetella hinzii]|nr:cupin domain-containing protein [Bordetella hinzii]